MRSVLFHIGPHKTGTTYLQKCLAHQRERLSERGFALPTAWQQAPGNPSHTGLVAAVREGGDLAAAARVIDDVMRGGAHTLIVSAEDLASLPAEAYLRLRALFDGWAATVIFYVRRWSDMLPSDWQELVKHGASTTFPEHLLAHLRNPAVSRRINLDMPLKPVADAFGPGAIRLVCYSVLRESDRDLFQHFATSFLNWRDAPRLDDSAPLNASRDVAEIELIRVLNTMEFARTGRRSAAVRDRFDTLRDRLDTRLLREVMEEARRTALLNDAFPHLNQLHKGLFEQYREQIVPPAPQGLFFRPMRQEVPYIGDTYLLEPGVMEAYRALYSAIAAEVVSG